MIDKVDKFAEFSGNTIAQRNLKRKSVHAALFMASGSGADFMLRLISTGILARLLLPDFFGLVAMVTAVTGIVEAIRDLGLASATVQRNDISHRQVSNLFWINLAAGVLFCVVFCIGAKLIAEYYHELRLIPVTIAISTTFIFSGSVVQHEALLYRQLKQGRLVATRISGNLVSLIVAIVLAEYGFEYWALVWREITRNVVIAGGVWLSCRWVPSLPSREGEIRSLLSFGTDLSVSGVLGGCVARLDGLLIGRFFGAYTLGIYRQAYQLIMVPIEQLNSPIISVAQPALSRLQVDVERYRRYYQKIVLLVSVTTVPLGLFVVVYAEEITLLVLGEKWAGSAVILRILAVAAVVRPTVGTAGVVLISCGRSRRYLVISVIHSLVLLGLMLLGVQWGAKGVALAHAVRSVVLMVPTLYYGFQPTPIRMENFWRGFRPAALAGAIMMVALAILLHSVSVANPYLRLFIGGVVAGMAYGGGLIMIPGGKEDGIALYRDVISSLQRRKVSESSETMSAA